MRYHLRKGRSGRSEESSAALSAEVGGSKQCAVVSTVHVKEVRRGSGMGCGLDVSRASAHLSMCLRFFAFLFAYFLF